MSGLAVETAGLVKRYGTLAAVDGLSMHVLQGAIYGFLGRNGAGKTTTLRVLAGLTASDGGRATVLGIEAGRDRTDILSRAGFVIDPVLPGWMTGWDAARFNRGFFPTWSDEAVRRYAATLEVPMDRKFKQLSQGNKTKLCLVMAMAQQPEVLVLDEPTAGMDPVSTDQLARLLVEEFAGQGRTVLLSSHHLSEVERIADWVGMVDEGKILLEARLDDIRTTYRRIRAAGDRLPASVPEMVTASANAGLTEYVVRSGAESTVAALHGQGAMVLEVLPLNLSEMFLALAGRESHVPVEVLA
ncbi:ABC transporter ATP-binding protein [Silvibacterium dinghuense]|uniref:ABC transporter ATP-binding protein n=1 Tax=Silvibacterium dinghuense TaxID=1560006 RepID=A0A4Q1SC28_9BACT|nr:ABC transporter ATP-binding protein [Silvibacterium dinghuense]RXS94575.1 ABC transporter ATP-binding protein [Silvibacterium dinghuense]GGH15253.1 ABC transporter ATP-binding protein [Silvibacterium dinghuense]